MSIDFNRSFASIEKSKQWSSKNKLISAEVYKSSGKTFIFDCDICTHEFTAKPIDITKGRWCPYCSSCILCESDSCKVCFNKSFASSNINMYLKDININPRMILKYSNKIYEFVCNICNHVSLKTINAVSNNIGCVYCSHQKLCTNMECISCFEKSFANSKKICLWSTRNTINPRFLLNYSHTKYLFTCKECNHDYDCSLANINYDKKCPYCTNRQLCNDITCNHCFDKSFASHIHAECWSNKNTLSARDVFKQTNKKYIFNCFVCNNEFNASCNSKMNGVTCSKCRNKTEKKLYDILKLQYNIVQHPTYDWCKNLKTNKHLPFDFECNNKIIIELDGLQHFKQIWKWKSPEEQKERDKYKMDCAIKNNKHIIRIYQVDVYYDRHTWKDQLINTINELINIDIPTIRYINIDPNYFI